MKTRHLLGASFVIAVAIALLASVFLLHAWTCPVAPVDRTATVDLVDETACAEEADTTGRVPLLSAIQPATPQPCEERFAVTQLQSFLRVSMNGPQGP